jgi:2-polyprenyl-6-hydroxyphenyl methylase/3-demethylubiquinone-9 3-methyltransferase
MRANIRRAASLVASAGLFVFALYRSTKMDWFWRAEKRWYTQASARQQQLALSAYLGLTKVYHSLTGHGETPPRGMDVKHDAHDWLGGYPYETILPGEVEAVLGGLGFARERTFDLGDKRRRGLLGTGCDEYVYRLTD